MLHDDDAPSLPGGEAVLVTVLVIRWPCVHRAGLFFIGAPLVIPYVSARPVLLHSCQFTPERILQKHRLRVVKVPISYKGAFQ